MISNRGMGLSMLSAPVYVGNEISIGCPLLCSIVCCVKISHVSQQIQADKTRTLVLLPMMILLSIPVHHSFNSLPPVTVVMCNFSYDCLQAKMACRRSASSVR